jgi:hypothetical protein
MSKTLKVDAVLVIDLFNQLRAHMEGVVQGAREWCTDESIRDTLEFTMEEQKKLINSFQTNHLTPVDEPIGYQEPAYVRNYDSIKSRSDRGEELDSNEIKAIYQTELFSRIWRHLKEMDYSTVPNEKLFAFIEDKIVYSKFTQFQLEQYESKGWFNTSYAVTNDVVAQITEARKKAPQVKLF